MLPPMLYTLFSIVAPVFICAAIGFAWARAGRPFDTDLVTSLVTVIGAPCLAFHILMNADVTLAALSLMAGATLLALLGIAIIGVVLLRVTKQPLRAFLPPIIFGNSGNMGLPLTLLAFGEEGLALAIGVFAVHVVTHFVGGAAIAAGSFNPKSILRMPIIWAVILAVALRAYEMDIPQWILETTELLAGMTIPLMLITLGISLAGLKVQAVGRSIGIAVARLAIGFVVASFVAWALALEGLPRAVLILELSMPCAVFNYLFAARYKRNPEEVAGVVLISTIISFATLPVLLWYLINSV